MSFLNKLAGTLLAEESRAQQPVFSSLPELKIETDKATGQRHLKLPMPKRETLQNVANLLNEFLAKPLDSRLRGNDIKGAGMT